jgi:hypothetical protein
MQTFMDAYMEAMFWTECNSDNPELEHKTLDDLAPEALKTIKDDCDRFEKLIPDSIDLSQAGHDFWLTRNGHGAGFWDRGLGAIGDKLTDLAHAAGEQGLYLGDDGKLYVSLKANP